jgi:glutathionylspermidine synthase
MQRITLPQRTNWQQKMEAQGFIFHTPKPNETYWNEGSAYQFSASEIDEIEEATNTVYELCMQAVQHVIDQNSFHLFKIPTYIIPYLVAEWERDSPAIYGRFDFVYDGSAPPKMLEFNADTPTSLFEGSVVQWHWLQECQPQDDQFNSLHEKLLAYWAFLKPYLKPGKLWFTCIASDIEDFTTTEYLRDCAAQAGIETDFIDINAIGYNSLTQQFVSGDEPMHNLFKLYPWEWLVNEEFGQHIPASGTVFIEPIWKMLLSNKALLPVLWDLFPNHPNLLPAYFEQNDLVSYAKKPILSREGANVALYKNGVEITATTGEYGEDGYIYQALCELPNFGGNYPVIGAWVVGEEAAGMGIREGNGLITDNMSRFVPHFFR